MRVGRTDELQEEESGLSFERNKAHESLAAPKKKVRPPEMSGEGIRRRAEHTARIFPPPRPDGSYPEKEMTVPAGNDRVTYERMYRPTSTVIQFEQLDLTQRFDEMMAMLKDHSISSSLRNHMSMTDEDIVWNIKKYEGYREWVEQGRPVSIIPTTEVEQEYLKHWGLSTDEALQTGMIGKATERFTIQEKSSVQQLSEAVGSGKSQKGGSSKGGKPKGYLEDLLKSRPREGAVSDPEPVTEAVVGDSAGQSTVDDQPGPYETKKDRLRRLLGPQEGGKSKGGKAKIVFEDLLASSDILR